MFLLQIQDQKFQSRTLTLLKRRKSVIKSIRKGLGRGAIRLLLFLVSETPECWDQMIWLVHTDSPRCKSSLVLQLLLESVDVHLAC